MASVASDHSRVNCKDKEEEGNINFDREDEEGNVDLDGENEDIYGAPAPGASASPADNADGVGGNSTESVDNYPIFALRVML
jgi:hypothetical protein